MDVFEVLFTIYNLQKRCEHLWGRSIRIWKGLTSYFHLMKPPKWSLKLIKWLLLVKVVTSHDFGVLLCITSNWKILKGGSPSASMGPSIFGSDQNLEEWKFLQDFENWKSPWEVLWVFRPHEKSNGMLKRKFLLIPSSQHFCLWDWYWALVHN